MDKVRQWSLLTAVGVLAVLAGGWFLLVSPQRSQASDLRAKAVTQEQQNDTLRSQVAALRAQQKDLPRQQARLAQIATKIPDNPALPSLIRSLSDAADGAGVDLASLSPAPPTMVNAAVAAGAAGAAHPVAPGAQQQGTPAVSAPLAQIPVTLSVVGSYFNIEQFVASLEGLKRAMKVTGFQLQAKTSTGATSPAGGPADAPPGSLNATINAVIYMSPQVVQAASSLTPAAPVAPAKK